MATNKIEIKYQKVSINDIDTNDKTLINEAVLAAKNAYAPYSEFYVGTALKLENGKIIKANNQENAAYPSGLCAERVGLFFANANFPNSAVTAMAIAVTNKDNEIIEKSISPCGACRQVIAESEMRFKKPIRILLASRSNVLIFSSIQDLLPLSFNQGDLLRD